MGGAGRVRYRHLRRTVIAVLATIAFVLIFALAVRAVLEAEPTRRFAQSWLEETAAGYGAELEIGDLHWGLLPPGLRLSEVRFKGAGIDAEIDNLQVDLGRVWLTQRTIELGHVAASGVRLSLTGLPRSSGDRQGQVKVRVRQFSLEDLEFKGVDLPGKMALDLQGVRSSWSTEDDESRGFAEVASARLEIGRMAPVDFSLLARFVLDENGVDLSNYRLESAGFDLQGRGRIAGGRTRFAINGPVDIGWLDGFFRTRGLLDGAAEVAAVIDTRAPALIEADVSAPHLVASGFSLDNVEGRLALVNGSLRGTLTRADFFGGTVRGSYELAEFGGRYPHTVHLEGEGLSLEGFLDHLRIESAGLASNVDLRADGRWNGRSFPAGNGNADLILHGATPGLPVSGAVDVALTGEGFLLIDAEDLAIGRSKARWQGALTLGTWRPSWSIAADPADFAEIGPMVNSWVGSTVLPDGLAGTGHIQVDLSGPFSELTVNARIDAEPLVLDPIRFDRLVAETIIGGSMLRIGSARFQVADGFGEVEGGMAWGTEAGDDQIDLELRGRRIPLEAVASWIGLEQWVDSGTVSFNGILDGPVASPTGSWQLSIDDPALAGINLGTTSTTVGLDSGTFSCNDLSCDHGLEGNLFWNVHDAEIGGTLTWPQMPLAPLGEEMQRLAGETADVNLDFRVPFGEPPTTVLRAESEFAQLEIRGEPDTVAVAANIQGALEVRADLDRDVNGELSGDGTLKITSANDLLTLLAPEAGVPLTGTADASFTVAWKDEPLPQIEGRLESIDLELEKQIIQLLQPARFSLSRDGFVVPGLHLGARDDELFVRWAIDPEGQLRGNVSGTMDTLLLRFMLPDWEPAGRASGIVELLGSIEEPLFEGIAEIHKASFRLPGTRTILSQVEGTVFLSSGEVQLEGMDFRFMGGRGRASGRIRERDDTIVLGLDGTASGVRFEVLPDLNARLSGNWRLIGPIDDLLLSGDITVDRMSLTTKEDVASMLLGWLESSGGGSTSGGLNLALRVDAEETIELRNPFVRLTGSAALEVTGTSNSPGLVGQVELLEGGEATLLGNRYEIERGSLNFSNPNAIEPFIDLQAATWVQEFQISVQIAGTLDHFVTTAVSTPPLSAPDIYSLLGVGYTGRGYGSGAVGLGLASSILSSQLTSVLSRRGQLALPVDQVRVDPFAADSTGEATTRLSLIKQITPSWTVILRTTLSGDREQVVISRWYLAPGLFLEAAQHEDRSLSLDLKMRRPY
jgi:autotransporter translocation and assembly factor TamB